MKRVCFQDLTAKAESVTVCVSCGLLGSCHGPQGLTESNHQPLIQAHKQMIPLTLKIKGQQMIIPKTIVQTWFCYG